MTKRDNTRTRILKAGLELWPDVTHTEIARKTGISQPNVFYHFPKNLQDAVAEYAVQVGDSRVIVQLMGAAHPAVENLSPADRIRHFNAI